MFEVPIVSCGPTLLTIWAKKNEQGKIDSSLGEV